VIIRTLTPDVGWDQYVGPGRHDTPSVMREPLAADR
jgi:hypothetical protein